MVSIIIPTFNRYYQLERTLFYLTLLKTDSSLFEIIVIDNGSTDNTKSLIESYQLKFKNTNLYYHFDSEPGLLTGRHLGASLAKGDILTFIDDDVHVSSTWLDTIIEVMNNEEISLLTGPNLPFYESYPPYWLDYFWKKEKVGKSCSWLSLLDLGNEIQEISPNNVWGLNFTIRKSIFLELGGFHPDCIPTHLQMFQGDGETGLTMKAIEKGLKALYHPGVLLYHEVPSSRLTFEYFEKRAFYSGVCGSFFEIRKNNNFYKQEVKRLDVKKVEKFKKKFSSILMKIIKKNSVKTKIPNEIIVFNEKLKISKKEGYLFHKNEVNNNPELKKWVQKENFFDYKLPKI